MNRFLLNNLFLWKDRKHPKEVSSLSTHVSPSRTPVLSCAHFFPAPATQAIHCEEDKRAKAKEYDTNAIGVYVTHERPDAENTLAGHVPIELSR